MGRMDFEEKSKYDFELFDEKRNVKAETPVLNSRNDPDEAYTEKVKQQRKVYIRPKNVRKPIKAKKTSRSRILSPLAVFVFLIVMGMTGLLIYNYSVINEYDTMISRINREYNEEVKKSQMMYSKIEEQTDLRNIERLATDKLGMKKVDKSQIQYINISVESYAEVLENISEEFRDEEAVAHLLSGVSTSLNVILSYIN